MNLIKICSIFFFIDWKSWWEFWHYLKHYLLLHILLKNWTIKSLSRVIYNFIKKTKKIVCFLLNFFIEEKNRENSRALFRCHFSIRYRCLTAIEKKIASLSLRGFFSSSFFFAVRCAKKEKNAPRAKKVCFSVSVCPALIWISDMPSPPRGKGEFSQQLSVEGWGKGDSFQTSKSARPPPPP